MADEIKVKLVTDVEVNKQKIAQDVRKAVVAGISGGAQGKAAPFASIEHLPPHVQRQLIESGQVSGPPQAEDDSKKMERSRAAIERSIFRVREAQGKAAVGAAAVQREMRQGKIARDEIFAADIARIRGGGANEKINKLFRGQQKEDAAFAARYAKLHPTPPIIPPPIIQKTLLEQLRHLTTGGGLLGGLGKYQIGSSFLQSLGLGSGTSHIGGVALGAAGAAGGALGAIANKVAGAFAVLTPLVEGASVAFRHLAEMAEQGAKLYEQSRAIGRSTVQTSSYIKTLGAVGIEESMAMRLAAYGQFGRGRGAGGGGFRGSAAGEMIAAGRSGGMAIQELQQIANMSKDIDEAWRQTRIAAIATANVAYQNFKTITAWNIFENDFKTFWQQMSGIFGGVAESVLRIGHALMQVVNVLTYMQAKMLQGFRTIAEFVGRVLVVNPMTSGIGTAILAAAQLLPRSDPGNPNRLGGIIPRESHFSSLERMGLVIGGHQDKSTKYLERIAHNTARMADRLQSVLGGGHEHGSTGRPNPHSNTDDALAALRLAGSAFGTMWNLP